MCTCECVCIRALGVMLRHALHTHSERLEDSQRGFSVDSNSSWQPSNLALIVYKVTICAGSKCFILQITSLRLWCNASSVQSQYGGVLGRWGGD